MSGVSTTETATTEPAAPQPGPPERPRGYVAAVRERLVTPMPGDRVLGWVAPLLVAALAGLLRFWRLGDPGELVFDEKFYPQEAFSMLEHGVEYAVPYDGPGTGEGAEFVVHPPLGKWVIALGEQLFGYELGQPGASGFGWRFSVALLGTLGVLILARTGRRLFRSTLLGSVAGLLLACDGLHLVESRTALLDPVLTFFVICAFACVVADRDWFRARLADRVAAGAAGSPGLRPWLLGAGLCLGAAAATKWSGVFFLGAFGLLALVWTASARRTAGAPRPYRDTLVRDVPQFAVYLALLPLAAYLASWTGWFLSDAEHAYNRGWAAEPGNEGRYPLIPGDALRSLWDYHRQMYGFNVDLDKAHAYQSNPWSWLLLGRPVAFFFPVGDQAPTDCGADTCASAIHALGTPALWWALVPAVVVLAYRVFGRRDYRAAAILTGLAAGYLPWFNYQERTIFSFYAVVFAPFAALGVAMVLGMVLGGPGASMQRRTWGAAAAGAYLLVVVANLAYLWPILTAETIPYAEWQSRMWFGSWI